MGLDRKSRASGVSKGKFLSVFSNPSGFTAIPKTLLHGELVPPATWNHWEPCLHAKFYISATENNFRVIFDAHSLCCPPTELGCFSQARSSFCFLQMAVCCKGSLLALSFCISELKFSFKTEKKEFGVGDKMLFVMKGGSWCSLFWLWASDLPLMKRWNAWFISLISDIKFVLLPMQAVQNAECEAINMYCRSQWAQKRDNTVKHPTEHSLAMQIPALVITTPQWIQNLPCESSASKGHRHCPWILHPNLSTHCKPWFQKNKLFQF